MTIDIIIPSYNSAHLIHRLLINAEKLYKNEMVKEVVIVDDASTDDSAEIISTYYPWVNLIKKKINSGFSDSLNLGIRESNADVVFALNSDVEVNEKSISKSMVKAFKNPKTFAVSPAILLPNHELCSPHILTIKWIYGAIHMDKHSNPQLNLPPQKTLWVSTGSGLFNRKLFLEIGGLCEIFKPFYSEDIDICWRAWNNGFNSYWASDGHVVHHRDGTIQGIFDPQYIDKIKSRNRLLLTWMNCNLSDLLLKHFPFYLLNREITKTFLPAIKLARKVASERKTRSNKFTTSTINKMVKKEIGICN